METGNLMTAQQEMQRRIEEAKRLAIKFGREHYQQLTNPNYEAVSDPAFKDDLHWIERDGSERSPDNDVRAGRFISPFPELYGPGSMEPVLIKEDYLSKIRTGIDAMILFHQKNNPNNEDLTEMNRQAELFFTSLKQGFESTLK